ncbi:MAG: SPOR domain-containing protein [Treponema sp.]|nr:SPOR domain-containing protein [Treponema sp.]
MALINKPLILSLFLVFALVPLHAQNLNLASEIERLEQLADDPQQKLQALSDLARLYQLSGNNEKALEYRLAASLADPSGPNDQNLLEAAKLLISMGEFDKAGAELRTILLSSQDEQIRKQALLLNAQIEAFRSGDCGPLGFMADNPDFSDSQSNVLFTLWKISGDDSWKTRLLGSFPGSTEAAIADGNSGLSCAMTAQWLLLPEKNVAAMIASAAPADTGPAADVSASMLQTGLFNREDNAKKMADDLTNAGFKPVISGRILNGSDYWAVYVPIGADQNQTISQLKNSGFESFPVF